MSIFNQISLDKPKSNTFNLSHSKKLSLKMGQLIPTLAMECLPGDIIKMSSSQLSRFKPMLAPVMHKVDVYTHFFFVPNRILWDDWEDFITGGEDGTALPVFPSCEVNLDKVSVGDNGDYLGLPPTPGIPTTSRVSALPGAAVIKIYNEFFRDQNLIAELDDSVDSLLNNANITNFYETEPLRRAWSHDYFTSALPFTQKGPIATIPLGETAPILYQSDGLADLVKDVNGNNLNFSNALSHQTNVLFSNIPVTLDNSSHLLADLSTATSATIIDLRRAFKLQEWLERNARGGSRYIESILAHFGVKSSDGRLQRPEFLGGSKNPISFSEVLQTSSAATQPTPQANMAGHGIGLGTGANLRYFAEEHGYLIGFVSILPKTGYFQGIPKHFRRFDKFDYFWNSFAHIGEQPIYNWELYMKGNDTDDEVFGYTPRYAAYKYMADTIHGEFRTTLDFWHLARKFDNTPGLNGDFINCRPSDRIFAVTDGSEEIYMHIHHNIKAVRRMPYFGNPKM